MIREQSKHKEASKVSFARDIKPLFRAVDISHMKAHDVKLDDYAFMSDPHRTFSARLSPVVLSRATRRLSTWCSITRSQTSLRS